MLIGSAAKVHIVTTSFVCIIIIVCCGQPQKEKTDDFFGVIEQALIHLSALHMNDPRQPPNLFFILWGCVGRGAVVGFYTMIWSFNGVRSNVFSI